jgi:hypothetical protein
MSSGVWNSDMVLIFWGNFCTHVRKFLRYCYQIYGGDVVNTGTQRGTFTNKRRNRTLANQGGCNKSPKPHKCSVAIFQA